MNLAELLTIPASMFPEQEILRFEGQGTSYGTLAERVMFAAGALSGLMVPALWVVAVGSAITVAQRFARAYQEMERIDASERAALREQH